jgi:hypothetical protein
MTRSKSILSFCITLCLIFFIIFVTVQEKASEVLGSMGKKSLIYPVVDSGQDRCFSNTKEIPYPKEGGAFYGQDAQYEGYVPVYKDNGDGTTTDLNTGLMWQKTPNLMTKSTYAEAVAGAKTFSLGGYKDWRLPTIKELYSLIDFRGYSSRSVAQSVPYINTDYFGFVYGDQSKGERLIDAQYWSSTEYVGTTMRGDATVFGVNFADGRIKGYPRDVGPRGLPAKHFVRYVRGNPQYGINDFVDNGDGTITDRATGLMWTKNDSGKPMNWQKALEYAENLKHAGYNDWRLPNAKELQSIIDYSSAPDARNRFARGAAIDPIFNINETESYFWTSTTHLENHTCDFAVYICFGQAFGTMHGRKMNVHGAGAQRSDPKTGEPNDWKGGNGPQGDEVRIHNYVRCVRGGNVTRKWSGPSIDGSFSVGKRSFDSKRRDGSFPGDMDQPKLRAGFVSRLDENGDGKVSRREFDGPPHHFDTLDKDGDGFLSEDEAPKGPPPRSRRPPRP